MNKSLNGSSQKQEFFRSSVVTPTGCLIRCQCDHVFSPSDPPQIETCPECGRNYLPGFVYGIEVLSKRSGMSLGIVQGEAVGDDLDRLAEWAVEERFGPDWNDFCSWQIVNGTGAYFGTEIEKT